VAGSVNKVILIGNIGRDPEVRHLENGGVVANFSIATTETYTDKTTGEKKDITDWHNIVAWRGLAGIVERFVKKGMKIYVEGRLKTRSWTDKEGTTRYITEIFAEQLTMLSRADSNSASSSVQRSPYSAQGTPEPPSVAAAITEPMVSDPADDLPF